MDIFMEFGASAVSMKPLEAPAGSEAQLEEGGGGPEQLFRYGLVTALFATGTDLEAVAEIVQGALDLAEPPALRTKPYVDQDWCSLVQQDWEPLPLGRGFEVRLPWHADAPPGGDRAVLRMEGGRAFGLGDHQTTQGVVSFLERVMPNMQGCRMLDYGTGSGILALVAASLGASVALGVDVDPPSVASARRNLEMNPLPPGARVEMFEGPEEFADCPGFAGGLASEHGPFDIVVANILRRPLVELAPALAAAARPGALLAMTGVRSDMGDFKILQEAYGSAFEDLREVLLEDNWLLVEGRRRQE
mmetsp:Transcript_26462/g.87780  ORF Transcript_26462/g.87780 Transcript_26462/m.87780 type:complete len:304 (-) Transcript_26462:124-1035(-)